MCKNWYSIFRTLPGDAALHGNVDDSSAYVFAGKPRAFGAPQSGGGLDGSMRRASGRPCRQCNAAVALVRNCSRFSDDVRQMKC
jgi:hypothetical protein